MASFGHSVFLVIKEASHSMEKERPCLVIAGIQTQYMSFSKALPGFKVINVFRIIHTKI